MMIPEEPRGEQPRVCREISATADCILPEELVFCILTRLPVKSLIRFRAVCKPWRHLFTTPEFLKAHRYNFSSSQENEAFIVNCTPLNHNVHPMSLLTINSGQNGPENLNMPHPEMDIIGCCNGLFCLVGRTRGEDIVLWNPATRLSKFVSIPKVGHEVAIGFGYDSKKDDFMIVRIVNFARKVKFVAFVYSGKADSWSEIRLEFCFHLLSSKSTAIVDGNPYWIVTLAENPNRFYNALLWFDVREKVFKIVHKHTLKMREGIIKLEYVDWRGFLAAIACYGNEERLECVDVWIFDPRNLIWQLKHTFGPVDMRMERGLACSRDGRIVGACQDGRIFVFDPENGQIKYLQIGVINIDLLLSVHMYEYSESFAQIA